MAPIITMWEVYYGNTKVKCYRDTGRSNWFCLKRLTYWRDYVGLDLESSDENKFPGLKREEEQWMNNVVKAFVRFREIFVSLGKWKCRGCEKVGWTKIWRICNTMFGIYCVPHTLFTVFFQTNSML